MDRVVMVLEDLDMPDVELLVSVSAKRCGWEPEETFKLADCEIASFRREP